MLYVECIDNGVFKMFIVSFLFVFVLDVFEVLMDVIFFLLIILENVSNGVVVISFIVIDVDFMWIGYVFELMLWGVLFCLVGNLIVVLWILFDYEVMLFIMV